MIIIDKRKRNSGSCQRCEHSGNLMYLPVEKCIGTTNLKYLTKLTYVLYLFLPRDHIAVYFQKCGFMCRCKYTSIDMYIHTSTHTEADI